MSDTPASLLLLPRSNAPSKGDFTENFICTQIKALRTLPLYYFSKDNSQLELDFILQLATHVIPLEVKAEENLQAKSLKTTLAAHPDMNGLRFSMSDYREQDRITNVPLYGASAYLATAMASES